MSAFISCSLFTLSLNKAHFIRMGRIKIPNSLAAWLWHLLWSVNCFPSVLLFELEVPSQSGFWSESDLVQVEKAVCVIKCCWGFLELFFEVEGQIVDLFLLDLCSSVAVRLEMGVRILSQTYFHWRKALWGFVQFPKVWLFSWQCRLCACLSPICIF